VHPCLLCLSLVKSVYVTAVVELFDEAEIDKFFRPSRLGFRVLVRYHLIQILHFVQETAPQMSF
jgi:hypothetical protein